MNDINTQPSQFQIFKKKSALRIQLDKPDRADQKYKIGCLYLQVAPSKGEVGSQSGYDWEDRKISVKIGVNDISKIIDGVSRGANVDLMHTFNDDTKVIRFSVKDGGGYFLNIDQTSKGNKTSVAVPLSGEEIRSFMTMLSFALPLIHNWI
jgi:hypothetical protein